MSEWYTLLASIGTLASAIITAIIAAFLFKQTKQQKVQIKHLEEQNNEIKKEIAYRMRPWIKIESVERAFVKHGNTIKPWNDYAISEEKEPIERVILEIKIQNIGELPSKNVFFKSIYRLSHFDKKYLWNLHSINPANPLMPKEKRVITMSMPQKDFLNSKQIPVCVGIHVGYFLDDTHTSTIGKIWLVSPNRIDDEDYWIDEP